MLHDIYEKAGPSTVHRRIHFGHVAFVGTLIVIILYGSSSLISAIALLRQTQSADSWESFVSSQAPPLLGPKTHETPEFIDGKKVLDLPTLRSGVLSAHYKQLQWIQEPESILNDKGTYVLRTELEDGDSSYVIKSIANNTYEYTLFNSTSFLYGEIEYFIEALVASPNLSKAVLKTNATHNWRHSTFALYWVLDVHNNIITPLRENLQEKIATFKWAPTSTDIAYVYANNLYIKNIESGNTTQVTFDGGPELFYGKPDWVYEEEVFASDIALWWAPTGDKVAFLKTNDTFVPEYSISYFVQDEDQYQDYPETRSIKYPKAGYPNPIVDILVYSIYDDVKALSVPDFATLSEIKEKLITEVVWVSNDHLLVKTSNRASDLLDVFLINANTNEVELVRQHSANNSWFEVTSNTVYVPKNESNGRLQDGYIDTVVIDGYEHLAYFSPPTSSEGIVLTNGRWEVVSGVESLDLVNNIVYFIGTQKSSVERHLYSVKFTEATQNNVPKINNITDISKDGWYTSSFSSGSRYLLLTYKGPQVPYQKLIDLHDLGNESVTIIEDNKQLIEKMQDFIIPETKFEVVTIGKDEEGNDIIVNAMETLPPNFDRTKKYPLLFFMYGGPGSQLVQKSFAISFSAVVASQLNAVVVTVDGRGTGFNNYNANGANFKFCVRDQLGFYEPRDQISAAKVWRQREYIDKDRIAIWGWSYGGFLTLKTLETDVEEHVFSYGMAVAPVTKWRLYDSIYTERYMRTPQENPSGYETASIHNVSNFANVTRFMLAHGTGDDNVHFQNTLKLVDELNLATIENFDFYLFPDSDHAINYHNGGTIVYDRLLNWLKKAFNGDYLY